MGPDSLYCGKWRKISKSRSELDLDPTMPNIELDRDIFIRNNLFKFHVPRSILFELSCKNTHTHTQMHTHTDSNEYFIVVFCKNATITRKRFSEKPIVGFTNSTVFLLELYIYMTKPVWSHVLAFSTLPIHT